MMRFTPSNPYPTGKAAIAVKELTEHFDRLSRSKEAISIAIKLCAEADLNVSFNCFGGIYCAYLNTEEKKNTFIGLCGLHQITVKHFPLARDSSDHFYEISL